MTGGVSATTVFAAISAGAAVYGASQAGKAKNKAPDALAPALVTTNPVVDDIAAQTKAAQDAALGKRQKTRQNSLLSQAGGAGDLSLASTARGTASPKLALGE